MSERGGNVVDLRKVRDARHMPPVNHMEFMIAIEQAVKMKISFEEIGASVGMSEQNARAWLVGISIPTARAQAAIVKWLRAEMKKRSGQP